eukprot:m.55378 g.55378  ORF g.55378 m.55378 type:complete len:107 (+) comp11123_c1_seq5:3234-3554(+)
MYYKELVYLVVQDSAVFDNTSSALQLCDGEENFTDDRGLKEHDEDEEDEDDEGDEEDALNNTLSVMKHIKHEVEEDDGDVNDGDDIMEDIAGSNNKVWHSVNDEKQ